MKRALVILTLNEIEGSTEDLRRIPGERR